MKVFYTRAELRKSKNELDNLCLVPTMGALHEGHFSLVREALKHHKHVMVSIFINPAQFNNAQDFEKYPQSISEDLAHLDSIGCPYVWLPSVSEMYPKGVRTRIQFGTIDTILEGVQRPGHFSGVGLVVCNLLLATGAQTAYFGQKDLQQCCVIEQLVEDLSIPVDIKTWPTLREASGLAMSSRNRRLSDDGKEKASALYRALLTFQQALLDTSFTIAQSHVKATMLSDSGIELEYLSLVSLPEFELCTMLVPEKKMAVCIAASIEGVRLIDNLIFNA